MAIAAVTQVLTAAGTAVRTTVDIVVSIVEVMEVCTITVTGAAQPTVTTPAQLIGN